MASYRIPVELTWSVASGSPGVNVWHGRSTTVSNGLDEQVEMLEDFYTAVMAWSPATMSAHFDGEAFGVGDAEGDTYTAPTFSVSGTGGSEYAPPANAMLVSWKTGSGGRNGRGRTFLGPLSSDVIESNGTPAEDVRASIQTGVDALIDANGAALNGALGVYSRVENVLRDFTSGDVPNYFAVLRSRRD